MKINFKEFKVYTNLAKSDSQLINIVTELADGIYKTAQGIAGHSLALKIYNSKGEEEYTEEEFSIIQNYANQYGTPFFIDALNSIKNEQSITQSDQTAERQRTTRGNLLDAPSSNVGTINQRQ